ncbi:MAG TPA: metallophosphoesterase [Actinomycetota bacterium]|nr:metallophosphoesterase [Actinomycetota bacterium]
MSAAPAPAIPDEHAFHPQEKMVRWFSPRELANAGLRVVLSAIFGAYADKRELQAALRDPGIVDCAAGDAAWVDYVSDLGDGFHSTYSVAYLLARPELEVTIGGAPLRLPRGNVLVMGGDEVYPTADVDSYQDRTLGPYRAALPHSDAPHPILLAVPGNHDWYDGLTSFMRIFCQGRWVGGWQTKQTRSYFAVQLPHRWWLWAIDIQFDTYIDAPQLAYFRDTVAPKLEAGDGIILCSAKPSWVETQKHAEAYATLDYFERELVEPHGAHVRMNLTGDTHHYVRYRAADGATKITAGGGGAYLSATHHLPTRLDVPPPESVARGKSDPVTHELRHTWPSAKGSRTQTLGVFSLLFKNPSFAFLMGALYALFGWAAVGVERAGLVDTIGEVAWKIARSPFLLVVILVGRALVGFTKSSGAKRWLVGIAHTAAHLVGVGACVWIAAELVEPSSRPGRIAFVGVVAVAGAVVGTMVMAAYLYVADWFGCNTNEVFAAQHLETYKNFLRLKVDDAGVTVYPIGVEKAWKRWRWPATWAPGDSAIQPEGGAGPQHTLIEEPFVVTRTPEPSGGAA